jgi:hypothetical protein
MGADIAVRILKNLARGRHGLTGHLHSVPSFAGRPEQ